MDSTAPLPKRSTLVETSFKYWLPLAVLATVLSALAYGLVQQTVRQSANDPQIQLAEDAAAAITNGSAPQSIVPAGLIDIAQSLAPFIIVFDENGQLIASSARLDGQTPMPPSGVFASARDLGEDRFTWQPKPGVRIAAVIIRYSGDTAGFALVGRSLREVEIREDRLTWLAFIGWLAALAATLIAVVFILAFQRLMRKVTVDHH